MSLSAILEAILNSGEMRVEEIEAQGRTQVQGILAQARQEAEQVRVKAYASAVAPAARERARLLHRVRLEALHATGSAREALVDAALDRARGHLAGLRRTPAYPSILPRLALQALDELAASLGEGAPACFEVDRRDQELLERCLKAIDKDIPVMVGPECWGGVIAKSQDGKVVVINTLESRLERATPYLRHVLAASFEDDRQALKDAPEQEKLVRV